LFEQAEGVELAVLDAIRHGTGPFGIVGLVDEATGYQEVRDKMALQAGLGQAVSSSVLSANIPASKLAMEGHEGEPPASGRELHIGFCLLSSCAGHS
jgi:hypothetical protein